jgi:hypothetical protein
VQLVNTGLDESAHAKFVSDVADHHPEQRLGDIAREIKNHYSSSRGEYFTYCRAGAPATKRRQGA